MFRFGNLNPLAWNAPAPAALCGVGEGDQGADGGAGGGGGDDAEAEAAKKLEATIQKKAHGIASALIDKSLKAALGPLQEQLAAMNEALAKAQERPEPEDQSKKAPSEAEKKIAALEARIDSERKAREKIEAERDAERQKVQRQELHSVALAALADAGISNRRGQIALTWLESQGKLARDESGALVMREVERDGIPQDLPLAEGVALWAKGDDAKEFLPPTTTGGGSGARGGGNSEPVVDAKGKLTREGFGQLLQKK